MKTIIAVAASGKVFMRTEFENNKKLVGACGKGYVRLWNKKNNPIKTIRIPQSCVDADWGFWGDSKRTLEQDAKISKKSVDAIEWVEIVHYAGKKDVLKLAGSNLTKVKSWLEKHKEEVSFIVALAAG